MEEKFHIVSKYDDYKIFGAVFVPENIPIKGIVQIAHGMCEHKERYFEFMRFLNGHGYITVISDHRGHGESVETPRDLGYFGDTNGDAIVEDLLEITLYIKNRFPGYDVMLFGHSMGSLVVRKYIQNHDAQISKLIVCGSPSQNPLVGVGIAIAKIIGIFKGPHYRSEFVKRLATGNGNKRFAEENDPLSWVVGDPKVREAYRNDPFCNFTFTVNGYLNLFRLVKHVYTKSKYNVVHPDLPILFIAGAEDPVIVSEEKWRAAQSFLKNVGYQNLDGILYTGMRHEILNELEKEKVYMDILQFISGRE